MEPYLRSFLLFFALFNPFLMSIYLLDLIRELSTEVFTRALNHQGRSPGSAGVAVEV